MTMFLDVFPEVEILNTQWEGEKLPHIHPSVDEEEIQQALVNIKKNFAEYKDAQEVSIDTISKIGIEFLDAEGNVLDIGTTYVGEQEFAEENFFHTEFLKKKKDESREIAYDEKKLPAVFQYKKSE